MHIGYVISRYPAVSHTFVQREVLGLRKLGWNVTTISIRATPASQHLTDTDRDEARRTHALVRFAPLAFLAALFAALMHPFRFGRALSCAWSTRRPGAKGAAYALFYFAEALLLHRICRREKIQHLHAHFANVAADVAMIAAVLNAGGGGTFSFTMHGPTEFSDVQHFRLTEKTRAARFVLCISDFARSQLMSLLPPAYWSKLYVVHCGVELRQFHNEQPRTKPKENAANILCVARLAPEKGHAILLQAIAELTLRGHELTLTLVGDGLLRDDLTRLAEVLGIHDRVSFLGNVGQGLIHQHYTAADLFVLPSFAEGVPVVLMEAMAARCPVISTRIAGISELIEHASSGLLVAPGRPDLLADAMEQLLLNPRAADRIASAALEKIRRDFNLETIIPQLAHIFRRVLAPQTLESSAPRHDTRHRAIDRPAELSPSRAEPRPDPRPTLREEIER